MSVHANLIPAGHKFTTETHTVANLRVLIYYFGWFVLHIIMPAKVGIKSCRLARECVFICETCLTNCTRPISHHIMPLVINALRGGHTDTQTHTHTYIPMCEPKQFQENRCVQLSNTTLLIGEYKLTA